MKPLIYEVITDKRSIPFNSAGTGTIATHGIAIVGTGTLFTTEMRVGSFLVDLTNNEVRKVYRVDSDTLAFLEVEFTADIVAGATPQIVKAHQCKVKEVELVTAGACFIAGVDFTGSKKIDMLGNDRSARPDLIAPFVVDATGQTMAVTIVNY